MSHQVGRKVCLNTTLYSKILFKQNEGKARVGVAALPGVSVCTVKDCGQLILEVCFTHCRNVYIPYGLISLLGG